MHQEGHIESGSGYSSGPTGGRTTNTSTNRTPFGSAGTDMGSGMMGNPTMGGEPMMVGMMGLSGTEMSTMGVRSPNVNMNLPLASAIPINVDENIQNLQQIQSFPVVGTGPNGIHFHQDPVTGQMYRMTAEFHDRISQILGGMSSTDGGIQNINNNLLSSEIGSIGSGQFIELNSLNNYVNLLIDNTDEIFAKSNNSIINNQIFSTDLYIQSQNENTYILDQRFEDRITAVNKFSDINAQTTFKSDDYKTNRPLNIFSDLIPQLDYIQTTYNTNIQVNKYSGV